MSRRTHSISRRDTYLTSESEAWWFNLLLTSATSGAILRTILSAMITLLSEMEKRNKIAQTQVLDLKIAQKTRNLRHIIIHAKTA